MVRQHVYQVGVDRHVHVFKSLCRRLGFSDSRNRRERTCNLVRTDMETHQPVTLGGQPDQVMTKLSFCTMRWLPVIVHLHPAEFHDHSSNPLGSTSAAADPAWASASRPARTSNQRCASGGGRTQEVLQIP